MSEISRITTRSNEQRRSVVRFHAALPVVALIPFFMPSSDLIAQEKVEVRAVKYKDLADTIRQLKGKVVVVDFWANW